MGAPPVPASPATGIKQTIQARHGVATFVPQGYTITIINTYGKQVVDTWAFALHAPPEDGDINKEEKDAKQKEEEKEEGYAGDAEAPGELTKEASSEDGPKAGSGGETEDKLEEQSKDAKDKVVDTAKEAGETVEEKAEEAGESTKETPTKARETAKETTEKISGKADNPGTKKTRWSAYIPSLQRSKSQAKKKDKSAEATENENMSKSWSEYIMGSGKKDGTPTNTNSQQKGWSSYIPSGVGYGSYVPSKDSISAFASSHYRDPTKSYAEQLFDFSKTPVGAGVASAATGSGYAGSLYAAYKAYESVAGDKGVPGMEYMSMMHTRASTLHLSPRVGDSLVSNLRIPLLTVVEDTSPGVHDTLIAACDPQRYKELGAEKWEEHGSCSENCVLALKEINERSGLTGKKAIGSDVTVNTVPAPLNLFMNIPWTQEGDVSFDPPKTKRGDYIKLRAERDVVVVMSACPQDILSINGNKPMVAHFVVESETPEEKTKQKQEAETILAKTQRRMSKGKLPKTEEPAPPKKEATPPVKSPVANPRPGRKPPRKLEKRGSSAAVEK